jgi:hypothetical protein
VSAMARTSNPGGGCTLPTYDRIKRREFITLKILV